jgi:hypothetical protein
MAFAAFQTNALADPEAARAKRREINRAYHEKRWAEDPAYRERKRAHAKQQQADSTYNEKRRVARARKTHEEKRPELDRARQWALDNAEAVRSGHLRRKYNLTPQEVDRMQDEQGNACRLCEVPFSERKPPNVDHCHKTGRVRGLLCTACNTALGKFKDDPALLRKAALYVEGAS